jgi:hypothetical protein
MISDAYAYFPIGDNLFFGFISNGINGEILKIVIFTPTKDGKWNLAFGDWRNKDIDDKVMTNNHDVVKVIGTVAKVTYDFFKKYPEAVVVIDPVDEKRKKLYNVVFQRHHKVIANDFHIHAQKGEQTELYSSTETYDRFELFLKSK